MEKLVFSEQKGWQEKLSKEKKRKIYNFLNSHDLYQFKNNKLFRESVISDENVNYIDGFMITLYFSVKNLRSIPRLSGPELIKRFFINKELSKKKKHFFIGFEEKELDEFVIRFPYLDRKKLFGYNPPYIKGLEFSKEEIKKMSNIINSKKIDFVWVGVGCPKQNILSKKLFKKTKAKSFFNIGAALDFVLERKSRAPKWIQEIGLEWLYRLVTDFNHTRKKAWKSFVANKYLFKDVELKSEK